MGSEVVNYDGRLIFRLLGLGVPPHYVRGSSTSSTFRVKDKEGIEDPKSRQKCSFSQGIANLSPNFGLGLTKPKLFS